MGPVAEFKPGMFRALASDLIDRLRFARQAGVTFGGKRDEYEIFGYDRVISLQQYRDEFARGGVAKRIVTALPNATWRGKMELIEDEDTQEQTAFEKAWSDLDRRIKASSVLRRADILAGLGYYSAILIGAPGELDTELPKGSPDKLMYLAPYAGGGGPGLHDTRTATSNLGGLSFGDAAIYELETDAASPRFGQPKLYQLRRTDVSSVQLQRPVHWTRIIHIAEGCLDNDVYGTPALEAVWNLLVDLRKVTGGGAEAFFQRANQGLNLNLDKDVSLDTVAANKLKEEVEEYQHNISRVLKTRGMNVEVLGSDVASFADPADAILTQIAGTTTIPKRILTGSEMGELASSQDRDNWKDQVNGRQETYAGPYIVRPLVDRLIAYGYLPKPSKGVDIYEVTWPHIQTLTEQEKAEGASKWASTNATQGAPVFTGDEIRDKWYGFGPLTPAQLKKEAEVKAAAQPQPPAAPGAPVPGEAEPEITPEGVVDALLDGEDEAAGEDAEEENAPEPRAAGGPGSGNFGHSGRPGQVGGSSDDSSEGSARSALAELTRGRRVSSDDISPVQKTPNGHEFGVRYFGDWEVPAGEGDEDDGDYDWKVPTASTAKSLDAIAKKIESQNPDVKVVWGAEEKNWVFFRVSNKGAVRSLGGPGSGTAGHTTPDQAPVVDDPVAKEVSKWSSALARAGGSLKRSSKRSEAQIAHKKQEDADRTARQAVRKLETKGFKVQKDGTLLHKDGRKAMVTTDRKFRVGITIIKAPKKKVEEPKAAAEAHKYASVQINLPSNIATKLRAFGQLIDDADLVEQEDEAHVTVKYGFTSDDPFQIERALSGFDFARLELGDTAYFEGDESDVVYVKVNSPDLVAMNAALSSLDHVSTHPTYTPHATIAYVKPGTGAKYAGFSEFAGLSAESPSVVFSPAEGEDSMIDLGLRAAAEDEELLKVLEAAILADNEEVISALIGVTHRAAEKE